MDIPNTSAWVMVARPLVYENANFPGYQLRHLPVRDTKEVWELWHGDTLVQREEISYAQMLQTQDSHSLLIKHMDDKAKAHAAGQ